MANNANNIPQSKKVEGGKNSHRGASNSTKSSAKMMDSKRASHDSK